MSVVSFIEEPKNIDRIIRHLELTFEAERPPPPRVVQQHLLMAAEESMELGVITLFWMGNGENFEGFGANTKTKFFINMTAAFFFGVYRIISAIRAEMCRFLSFSLGAIELII